MKDQTIEYNGCVYRRRSGQWADSNNLLVPLSLQFELNEFYASTVILDQIPFSEILNEADKFKESGSNSLAIKYYTFLLEHSDMKTTAYVLPRITSCLRKQGRSRDVIALFADAKKKYGLSFLSSPLLTSVAAAYCDLGEYENALKCCNNAYRLGGKSDELGSVYQRIKKESSCEV